MRYNNLVFFISLAIILLTLVNLYVTFDKITNFKKSIIGFTLNQGYVNITINSFIYIEIPRDTIDWGSGYINESTNATLYTNGDFNGIVLRGNWSGENVSGLIVRNSGNVNCSIKIYTLKNAHDLFSSASSENEEYKIRVSNRELGSCVGTEMDSWKDVNTTIPGDKFCSHFNYEESQNEIFIDVLLTVPYDSTKMGRQSDLINILGDVAG